MKITNNASEQAAEYERLIRDFYAVAEQKNVSNFAHLFTPDGYFYDIAVGGKCFGEDIGKAVTSYATAFPDMHRALDKIYDSGNVVVVELSLNGTHTGPLTLPAGVIPPTSKTIHVPCCDVFHLEARKVKLFHCCTAATILFGQIGVLADLGALPIN